ncbi:MAG: hypothetical protein C5B60_00045 [Chloroflexi bacterium]|nr:MAG: hypothetical protein C5B60_00045 [Chloroflexota bacterium]
MSTVGRSRAWLWALGSVLAVVLLVGSAYVAHRAVVNNRAPQPVQAPAARPLDVVGVTAPGPSYELLAEDAVAGRVVALASTSQPVCPPIGLCPLSAPYADFVVFDAASGTIQSQTALSAAGAGGASQSVLLLVDDLSHIAYAIAPRTVSLFSTTTGVALGGYDLPASLSWPRETGGTLDPGTHTLILAGDGQLASLDAMTGQLRVQTKMAASPPGVLSDGPILDAPADTLYLLAHGTVSTEPLLLAYDATTLNPLSQLPVPGVTGLGPLTPDERSLTLYEADGMVSMLPALRDLGAAAEGGAQGMTAAAGATALGWVDATPQSELYVATATGIDLRNAVTGQVLASLPMQVDWAGSEALLVDTATGSIYLPGAHGQVVVARPPKTGSGAGAYALSAATAVVLAHSALSGFLPFTNQDPPFITPDTFLLSATAQGQSIPMTYWIHYIDFQWSLGPYPGTTSAMVQPDPAHTGAYLVTFTIRWNETFWRSHSWVCAVAPDASVTLRSDTGDIVP